ncbi:hypothetical protein F4677DRAFT_355128 [Hypoxylon crocopeplum]|nr:hypothetical protein F4677DRAFT_355128 [Hypoxylon crocopeplum]
MEDSNYRYRVNYSENIAPKYPAAGSQEGLEVVPNDSPLYPLPTPAPIHTPVAEEKWTPTSGGWTDAPFSAVTGPEDNKEEKQRRILGLTVPLFWALIVIIVVILAGAIGGGIGGGLKAQQKSNVDASSDTTSSPQPSPTAAASSSSPEGTPSPTAATSGPLPSDSGCPLIEGQTSTPYAVDGKPIPLEQGLEGQQFRQHCYTNYVASAAAQTHDILKIFMPTLENCMMTCAAYNQAYRAGLNGNAGVGGGYCVGVSIEKFDAGFCYLKNATSTNDTMGQPNVYSSAVLLTDVNSDV